jgi:DNA-binding transcriptional LysR family regulator
VLGDINELRTFVRIATIGSLSGAGRDMGVALSVVSKRLAALETRVNTRLIARSTRRLSLTDEGAKLFERAQRILAEVDEAETVLTRGHLEPQGLLRISAPIALGRAHVSVVCRELTRRHGEISLDLVLTDRLVGLIDEGFDVAIRIGEPKDSGLIVRKLADNHRVVVGTTAYLAAHGTPTTPAALAGHECIHQGAGASWRLIGPEERVEDVDVKSRLRCNNGEVWHDWVLADCGLAMRSWIDVASDIQSGRLVHVLPEWRGPPAPVCALLPTRQLVPTRVRVFLEAMAEHLRALRAA